METKELLEAIQKIISAENKELKQEWKQDLFQVKEEISHLSGRLSNVEDMLETQGTRLTRVEVLLEHDLPKQIQTLAEGHSAILERIPEADEIDTLRNRVRTLERVVTSHSQEINELKQAN